MTFTKEQERIMAQAIDKYGTEGQMLKCVEELAELSQALTKYLLYAGKMSTGEEEVELVDNLFEELADVLIMTHQMTMILDEVYIRKQIEAKLDRLHKRLYAFGA